MSYSDSINTALAAPAVDPRHIVIANALLSGDSVTDIAFKFNLPEEHISSVLELAEVRRYIDNVYLSQGYMNRSKRLNIINTIIDKKLEEALDTGIYTKEDIYKWLELLHKMERDTRPKSPTTAIQVNQNNNYHNLLEELLK